MGVPADEPPGETPHGGFAEPLVDSGPHDGDGNGMDIDDARADDGDDVNMHFVGSLEPEYDEYIS